MNITAVLRECALDLLATEPKVSVEHVVDCAYQRHGDAFLDAQEQMVRAAARSTVANLMRDLARDENEQQAFAGMEGLPSAIAVQTGDGTYYVRSDKAVWHELQAGRNVRTENVERAVARLDAYETTLDVLAPYMEHYPDVSVADAVRLMGPAAA